MSSQTYFFLFRIVGQKTLPNLLLGMALLVCSTLQAQSLNVGFTRIDHVLDQLPESKQVTNQLAIQRTQAENEFKRLQKEFDEKYASYQKNGAQLTETVRKDRETELQNLQTRIQEFSRSAQESLQEKYKQLMSPILGKVQQAIDTVAKQNGYHFILNKTDGGPSSILYASEENDVTGLVLKRLSITPTQASDKSAKISPAPVNTRAPQKK